jgi:hypothetical protein
LFSLDCSKITQYLKLVSLKGFIKYAPVHFSLNGLREIRPFPKG